MAKQTINIGTSPNARDGDPIRIAFQKANENFTELYNLTGIDSLTELAQDYAAAMFTNGTHNGISVSYDDANNKINLTVPAGFSGSYNDLSDKPSIPPNDADGTKYRLIAGESIELVSGSANYVVRVAEGGVAGQVTGTLIIGPLTLADSGNTQIPGTITFPDGSIQTTAYTGGGAANTGDITFSGVKIIGAGTASGDGNGYSTLELVPDNNLYANNQYLVIDPTQPNHIHIRAGGTQDASTAELYLGGERNHVRVRDDVGVKLQNDQFNTNFYSFQQGVDYDTAVWSTDESNNTWLDITITDPFNPTRSADPFSTPFYSFTQYPQNRIEVFDGTNYIDLSGNGQAYTLGNQYQLRIGITETPAINPTSILTMTFRVDTLSQNALLLEDNGFDLSVNQSAYIYANQTIQLTTGVGNIRITADDDNSSQTWYFTAQGYLQFPQGLGPTTSKGKEGDEAGSVVIDGDYIYYCHTDYDGVTDIWKRVAWSNDTW